MQKSVHQNHKKFDKCAKHEKTQFFSKFKLNISFSIIKIKLGIKTKVKTHTQNRRIRHWHTINLYAKNETSYEVKILMLIASSIILYEK